MLQWKPMLGYKYSMRIDDIEGEIPVLMVACAEAAMLLAQHYTSTNLKHSALEASTSFQVRFASVGLLFEVDLAFRATCGLLQPCECRHSMFILVLRP